MRRAILTLAIAVLASSVLSQGTTQSKHAKQHKPPVTTDGYPLDTCPVSGKPINKPVIAEAGGRSFKLCCKGCVKKLEKSAKTYVKKLDAAIVAQQGSSYPLTACPISGEKLGSMGKPIVLVLDNYLVKLCCKGCVKKAMKRKQTVLAKLRAAALEQQDKSYTAKTCPVSGEELGSMGKPVSIMHGTRLAKLCCKGCVKKFKTSPAKYLAKLDKGKARAKKKTKGHKGHEGHKH